MRIVQEIFEREQFLEVCLTQQEFDLMKDYMIVSKKCYLNGDVTNIGVKLELDFMSENEDD